ncbi:MAG: alanine--tRNA ligase [Balneolaceae bacterium]
MSERTSQQIRQEFFDFFEEKEHLIIESAPVVPANDPTLLFTNAGMNPFKPIFLGEEEGVERDGKLWKRAANTQRCIRVSGKHNDLEEVGHDTYHHTLFEMLGNWSFGDYFKKEAIAWAWELLTDRWGLDPDRLYVTVFEGSEVDGTPVDQEARDLWASETGVDPDHILLFGKKDNFWEMGETGPCGPCSEIHVDIRPDKERKKVDGATLVNRDDPRVMEIWNLVFIQFNRLQDGTLEKLAAQHVDTGMGFERVCAILQGKSSNYDTDLFQPIIQAVARKAGCRYGEKAESDIAMRVIADHIRAVTFAIADGASPSNEGRGYVIRRILRRAIRYGYDRLGLMDPFLYTLVPVLTESFSGLFDQLVQQQEYLQEVIRSEEQSFLRTLGQGMERLEATLEEEGRISGEEAFKLHDTYGFPIDLTQLIARERNVEVDLEGYEREMQKQKERGRHAGQFKGGESRLEWENLNPDLESRFVGYDERTCESAILATASDGERYLLLLEKTPFYAESGGQVADTGILEKGNERLTVLDVQKGSRGHIHQVDRRPNDPSGRWKASVDTERRDQIERHHTATHLLHAALRQTLGDHVVQKGSLVAPGRLRFDFSHFERVEPEELETIASIVRHRIREDIPLDEERDLPIGEAKERGAMMLFGEKYGDRVRVITFDPDFSQELCGGTHVRSTGRIGSFLIVDEGSVAAGIRRIEALTGVEADEYIQNQQNELNQLRGLLDPTGSLADQVSTLIEERKALEKQLEKEKQKSATSNLDEWIRDAVELSGARLVVGRLEDVDPGVLKQMGYDLLERSSGETVSLLTSVDAESGKVYLMAAVSDDLIARGLRAGDLVRDLGKTLGGGGGGQPGLATAGGRFPEKIDEMFVQAKEQIERVLAG